MLSIACFNFTSVSVIKYASAAEATTINASVIVSIWSVSLLLGWESYIPMQMVGFVIIIMGTLTFNEIILKKKEVGNGHEALPE